jgi:electron transfer flavoprotein beta subunit
MRALVGVKRVIDYSIKARVKGDKSGIEKANVKMSMNPFCEIAVEEALKMKEKGWISHVTTLSIGDKTASETLRHSLALGADDAFHILTSLPIDTALQPLIVAKIFQKILEENKYDIILLGKQAIDDDSNQTSQILSALMNWPLANFASSITRKNDNNLFEVVREVDTGLEKILVDTPCVISCDLRLNTPRYTSLKNITAAKKKTIREIKIEDLKLDFNPKVKILEVIEPPQRKAGVRVRIILIYIYFLYKLFLNNCLYFF